MNFLRRLFGDAQALYVLKMGLFVVAMMTGIAGIALEVRWLVLVAIALLGVAFLLRFVGSKGNTV